MLAQQLRQRGFRAVPAPSALVGQNWLKQQDAYFSVESDGKLPSSTPGPSAVPTAANPPDNTGSNTSQIKNDHVTNEHGTKAAPPHPSPATSAALSQLKAKLASQVSASSQAAPPAGQSGTQHQQRPATSRTNASEGRIQQHQAASFQGVPLQLGEAGNPLQSMAALTHNSVQQVEDYTAAPLASDQRLLASLQKLGEAPQQRAATIMQMAAGTAPAPPVLVWAAGEVVSQLQQLLREQLPAAEGDAGELRGQPWYEGALQVARLALASQSQQQPQPQTELQLLRAFAQPPAAPTPAPAAAEAQPAKQQQQSQELSYSVSWEALLALPQLAAVLDAAASRSPALAASLDLTRVRSAVTAAARPPAAADRSAAAAAAGKAGKKQKEQPKQPLQQQQQPWLLPLLRSAASVARSKALEATGLAAKGADVPLNADAALTAIAMGTAAATPAQRAAAVEWLAAASLLQHAEERLGVAGGASGVRKEAVAVLQLLGLPLEPRELPYLDELKVSEEEVRSWLSQLASQLTAAPSTPAAALSVPAHLESRIASARRHLAAAGRALVLASSPDAASTPTPASTPAPAAATAAPTPEATLAWLRAVGAPLVSGLLSGGYDSVRKLQEMVPELREALVLRLLEAGRTSSGTTALAATLYGDAAAAWRTARADVAGVTAAAELLQREAVEAELDYVRERFVPPAPQLPPPPALPTDADLAAAVQALPPQQRQLYDSYYALRPDGSTSGSGEGDAELRRLVADALAAAGEGAVRQAVGGDLQAWLAEARQRLLVLPNPLLALLLRFLRVQVSFTPESAQLQRNKLTALAALVAQQQQRAAAAASTTGSSDDDSDTASSAAARELGQWVRGEGQPGAGGRVPAALSAVLGEASAGEFSSWLQALALSSSSSGSGLSTHELLAQQQMEQDVERYLTMTHDPRLHMPLGAAGPSASSASASRPTSASWSLPELRRGEAAWLEDMRPQLDAYLQAMGYRRLGDAEWGVYRDTALAEWDTGRAAREEKVAAAGQSGFFNPRADEVYLQQLLEENIAPEDPLGPQSRRYLDTLTRNRTWNFAQRKQAVQRLIQLNAHFLRQPPAPADGSPFAPLFAVGGPDPVPKLGPLAPAGQKQLQRRWGALTHGSGAAVEQLQLPEGF
ncbi:hypothetical protein Agub_g2962 [Astrephomene gubernaculifera]|uniref:Uncharacterized protein n=1 Tax=Astrephomene gubernaculifera TaxID=47775 RepID=A0AAD3DHV5_9CHLO|nr:hypothetical protein Agub_g2962 [Astrephomene gubernaculifera]